MRFVTPGMAHAQWVSILRRRRLGVAIPLAIAAATAVIVPVLAVHDLNVFQLDGNPQVAVAPAGVSGDDWDNVVCNTAAPSTGCIPARQSSVAVSSGLLATTGLLSDSVNAKVNPDTAFTTGGSKDVNDISQWRHNVNGAPDKDDLEHAAAAAYPSPVNSPTGCDPTLPRGAVGGCNVFVGDLLVYFALDRFDNSGSSQVSFWITKSQLCLRPDGRFGDGASAANSINCASASAPAATHHNGDVLVESIFTIGGSATSSNIYSWSGEGTAGSLVPEGAGVDCVGGLPNPVPAAPGDKACSTTNHSVINSPWTYTDKSGTANSQFLIGEFYEGGADISAALGLNPGDPVPCFTSFLAASRTSGSSTTAQLADFVLGKFAICSSEIHTTPSASTIVLGQSVTDSALLTGHAGGGLGPAPKGSVSFSVCGPLQSASGCASGGTAVGSAVDLTNNTQNPVTVVSAAFTPTSAGVWCFRADYSGDSNYGATSDGSTTECFTVLNPSTTLNKTVALNASVRYSYTETNDGALALTPPTPGDKTSVVTDPGCSPIVYDTGDNGNNVLDTGETWSFHCDKTLLTNQGSSTGPTTTSNTATGHGTFALGANTVDVTFCTTPDATHFCDADERDTNSVTVTVNINQGKP